MNTPHPELEALAALADLADLADPASSTGSADAELLAHVAECAQCAAEVAAVRGVRQTLRSLPVIPMPEAVAARLDAVIRDTAHAGHAAHSAHGASPADAHPAATHPAVVSVLPKRSGHTSGRGRWPFAHVPAAAAAAIVVVAALGAGIAVLATRGGGTSSNTTATSAMSAAGDMSAAVRLSSGANYVEGSIRSQVAALVLAHVPETAGYKELAELARQPAAPASAPAAGGAPLYEANSTSAGKGQAGPSAASTNDLPSAPAATGAPAAAPTQLGEAANGAAVPEPSGARAPARTAPSGPLADPAALQACVVKLIGAPETPLLVDYARYQGEPATIIVLADPATTSMLDLYVEADSADCVKNGDVTFYASLPAAS